MASLPEISEAVLLARAYYLELLAEYRTELRDTGRCSSDLLKKLTCLNRLIRALGWDIEDSVNDATTTILYNLLVTEISDFSGSALAVSDLVVTPEPSPILVLSGPQGERGLTGLQGVQGIQGVQGEQGIQGVPGEQGMQGVQGDQGIQGIQGVQGEQGIQGEAGQIIVAGEIANMISGPVDPTSADGIDGYYYLNTTTRILYGPKADGVWPTIGTQLNGDQGIQGIQGVQGEQGEPGIQGPQGIEGEQGIQGGQGEQGVAGAQGTTGEQGVKGDTGAQGETGAGVPEGGATGQVLAKASPANFDTLWVNQTSGVAGGNRAESFIVTDALDNEIGRVTSDSESAIQTKSVTGEVMFQVSPTVVPVVADPIYVDVAYTLSENEPDFLDLNYAFRDSNGNVLSDHYNEGAGLVGDGGVKPKDGELMRIELTYGGGVGSVPIWDGPVRVTLAITKNGAYFDGYKKEYPTPPDVGSLGAKFIQPDQFNTWATSAKAEKYTIPVEEDDEVSEVDTPPVNITTVSLVGGNDTITDGTATFFFNGSESYDEDGDVITHEWIINDPDATIEAP